MPYETIGVKFVLDEATTRRLGAHAATLALEAAGKVFVSDIKSAFTSAGAEGSKQATGRIYYRGVNNDIVHQASAPGQAPAVDTGRLRANIDSVMMPGNQRVLIGTPEDYAPYLEFGTSRIKPRPFFRPAVYRYRGNNDLMKKVVYQLRVTGKVK